MERGLRTDLNAGLSVDERHLEGRVSFDDATTQSLDKDRKSGLSDIPEVSSNDRHSDQDQFVDRIRIFDQNKLPERKSDGFFLLLWRSYNDKIIILLTIAAVVSLSLGLYETISSGGKTPEWVEGVAICVAIAIVTIVTATNDWQKERQFVKLNRRVSTL